MNFTYKLNSGVIQNSDASRSNVGSAPNASPTKLLHKNKNYISHRIEIKPEI
jgi:hypothetical protein